MDKLIIVTPAIPRPEIHKVAFESLYNCLLKSDKFNSTKIIHIINIDNIKLKNITLKTIENTVCNFNEIIPKNVEIKILTSDEPNFTKAYCNLFIEAEKYMDKNSTFLFFEDDWHFDEPNTLNILSILGKKLSNKKYILCFNDVPDNSPNFYSYEYFKSYVNYIKNNYKKFVEITNSDPDMIRYFYFKKILINTLGINNILYEYLIYWNDNNVKDVKYKIGDCTTKCNNVHFIKDSIIDASTNKDYLFNNKDNNSYHCYIIKPFGKKCVTDIGRQWRKNKHIKKWVKVGNSCKTY